jgi:hypothetical protein
LCTIKKNLDDFAKISGLKCNIEKTKMMQIGRVTPLSDEIKSLGFSVSTSLELLGIKFSNNLEDLDDNFRTVAEKMRKVAGFWERFKLSLPGRINVAKSLILPLVNHLGSILMPSDARLKEMQNILNTYVVGNLNIANKRIYLPTGKGGLGMFELGEFLTAQQCNWIIKADKSKRDNWRFDLHAGSFGNVLNCNENRFVKTKHPILSRIVHSFNEVKKLHENVGKFF